MGKPLKDESGNVYGRLTVIERAENKDGRAYWKCRCECGKETIVSGKNLRNGNTKSCGCLIGEATKERCRKINAGMIGQQYGYLTVIDYGDYAYKPDGRKDRKMKCECQLCGSIIEVRASDLKLGKQIACGCLNSRGNTKIKILLASKNITFATEYRFKDCCDIRPLPFDFALFKENKLIGLIEFQGIQHYDGLNHGWSNPEKFKEVQKHDNIKFSYCQKHSIPLYYITYLENIEERLEEIINELYR